MLRYRARTLTFNLSQLMCGNLVYLYCCAK